MTWKIEWDDRAVKELRKLGAQSQQHIVRYLGDRIATDEDPRRFGRALSGDRVGLWRYRVGQIRMICRIDEHTAKVLVLRVAHRKNVYGR